MLSPSSNFKEARELRAHGPTALEPYALPVGDDNPEALEIILYAIHLQNSKVPKVIKDSKTIWNIAVICDKYDCAAAISVWVDLWVGEWNRHSPSSDTYGEWVFIAWVFGLGKIFTTVTRKIILEGYYDKEGGALLSKGGKDLGHLGIPSHVIGQFFYKVRPKSHIS